MHRPTLFKFVVPDELAKYLPTDYAERNLARLRERVAILREFGLKATFMGQEPAYLPEEAYRDHPNWRGPRCDQCRRARTEYYAPCLDDAEMREIYVKAVERLCREAPFESFDLMCNDSGAGLCWYPYLYPGINGNNSCRGKPIADRIVDYLSVFQEGASRAGLKDVRVNMARYCSSEIISQVLPKLKPGQSVCNQTAKTCVKTSVVGFPNPFAEQTYPVYVMPRVGALVRHLQQAEEDAESDLMFCIRSLDEIDTIRLLRQWRQNPIGRGPLARDQAMMRLAMTFVSDERAGDLVTVWESIEQSYARLEWAFTGGHIFLLGTANQRWLTRPFVPFPLELTDVERNYWRPFMFQAQEETRACDMRDLQGYRWLAGYGGAFAVDSTEKIVGPIVDSAIVLAKDLVPFGKDAESTRYLEGVVLKLRLYRAVLVNARNAVSYQQIIDDGFARAKEVPLKDFSEHYSDQGDIGWWKINDVLRSEIDNTLAIIRILEDAQRKGIDIIRTAKTPQFETVMNLAPVPELIEQLKRKVRISEDHRRDHERIFRSYNK